MALNEDSRNKPYVLGRLFAALEKLQQDAAGGRLNSTIRDKYFASACASPGSVFPIILRLSSHHERNLSDAGKVYYAKLKQALMGKLDVDEEPYPAALTMQEQGRFILGYYHQTQAFYTKKEDKTNEEGTDNA